MRSAGMVRTPRGLAVEWGGEGERLLVIHGAVVTTGCAPLSAALRRDGGLEVVEYRRRGYDPTPLGSHGLDITSAARDAADVLAHLPGPRPAHVLGFSIGAHIALQLALDAAPLVRSLVLIEPALTTVPAAAATLAGLSGVMRAYEGGDRTTAVDRFLTAFAGEGCAADFDRCLPPGWWEQALAEAPIYFAGELPAALGWPFDRAAAASVAVPVLLVHGAGTNTIFVETAALLRSWLPDARVAAIPGANHFSPTFAPEPLAREVRAFVAGVQAGGIAPSAASGGVSNA